MTSSAQRDYVLVAGTANQTLSYRLRQNITFAGCPHARLPARQRLSVARAFALYDGQEHVLRYALAARVGSAQGELQHPPRGCPPCGASPCWGMLLSPACSQSCSVLVLPKNSQKRGWGGFFWFFFFPPSSLSRSAPGMAGGPQRGWHSHRSLHGTRVPQCSGDAYDVRYKWERSFPAPRVSQAFSPLLTPPLARRRCRESPGEPVPRRHARMRGDGALPARRGDGVHVRVRGRVPQRRTGLPR